VTFCRAYDLLQTAQPGIKGDVEYLWILHLAASTFEAEFEVDERRVRRIDRALRGSALPAHKTLATLNRTLLPQKVAKQLAALSEGGFVERGDNLLVFGLPGRGKSRDPKAPAEGQKRPPVALQLPRGELSTAVGASSSR